MGMGNTLTIGATGLQAHGEGISVAGDNIANVSTVGFKRTRIGFADVLGGAAPRGGRFGSGVRIGGIETRFDQGTFIATGGALDLAVTGKGFFVVNSDRGTFYTRDGRFHIDNDGKLVNPQGYEVAGYTINLSGIPSVSALEVNFGGGATASPPRATAAIDVSVNLDSNATVNPGGPAFDPTDASTMSATSNFATSLTIYDSLGNSHRVDAYFRRTSSAPAVWEWHAMVDGNETAVPAGTGPEEIANGTLQFDASGRLDIETQTPIPVTFTGAAAQSTTFDFGDSITTDGGTGLGGSTQFAAGSTVGAITQDGFGSGNLIDINISEDGVVRGRFSNGQERDLAQLALALFGSEDGLVRAGDSLFAESSASGQALIAPVGTGGRGLISSGSLEASNVDLASELVTLIQYQHAFQSNARVVTTASEMSQEVASLKR